MTNVIPLPDGPFRESSRPTPPRRRPNAEVRTREHLTPAEVEQLVDAAGKLGRHGHRDATMILLAFRHGLRVSELVALRQLERGAGVSLTHSPRRG